MNAGPLPRALALAASALAASCASPSPHRPRPLPPPWPVAGSADGMWRLRVEDVARTLAADGAGTAAIEIRARVEPPLDADTLLALDTGGNPLRRAVTDRGEEIPMDGHPASLDAVGGRLLVHGLRADAAARSLRLLEAEIGFLRVARWRESVTRPLEVGEGVDLPCAPARVTVTTEPTVCWVAAHYEDPDATPGGRDLLRVLGHDTIAGTAVVRDARGRELLLQAGMGTGGGTVCRFVPREAMAPSGPGGPHLIEFPVTVAVRIPGEYAVEPVVFRFEDLRLPPPRRFR